MLRPQRDWNPKSVELRADTLRVRLLGLLRAFPSLFTLQRSIHCNKTGTVAVNALLKCRVALDATCRLTLSILYFASDHAFVTSFLPFRSTFGIFKLFWLECRCYDHRGTRTLSLWNRTPNLWNRERTPSALGFEDCWELPHLCLLFSEAFTATKQEWLQWMLSWSVEWHSMLPVVSLYPYFTLQVIMLLWLHFFRLGARLGSSNFFD